MFQRQELNDNFSWYHSGQVNAPQMGASADSNGQLLQVLDAVLCDGFNSQIPVDIRADNNQIRLSFGTSHGFLKRSLVQISGANDVKLNGKHRVIDVIDNDIVIFVENVSNVSGDITVKVAPLDWENMFGTNDKLRRAYRSKNNNSTKTVLYLDMGYPANHGYGDNLIKRAMLSLCEDMAVLGEQINSYTDEYNDYANNPNGSLFWHQARQSYSYHTLDENHVGKWVIIGNQDYFFFFVDWIATDNKIKHSLACFAFGDFIAPKTDKYHVFLMANDVKNDRGDINPIRIDSYDFHPFVIRNFDGSGGLHKFTVSLISDNYGRMGHGFPQPNGINLITQPLHVIDRDSLFRGVIPRIHLIFNNLPNDLGLTMIDNMLLIKVFSGDYDYSYLAIDVGD